MVFEEGGEMNGIREMITSRASAGDCSGYSGFGGGGGSSSGVDMVLELIEGSRSTRRSSMTNDVGSTGEVVARTTKSHSEAEKRRRQRINAHLATLRTLLPNTNKMDKATLLTEVVRQLRELRRTAEEAVQSEGDTWTEVIPGESDEVKLDRVGSEEGSGLVRASVCCEDRPGLLADMSQAIRSVKARAVRAEMSTVGGRTKSVVFVEGGLRVEDRSTLQTALRAVLHKPGPGSYGFIDHKRLRLTRPVGRF